MNFTTSSSRGDYSHVAQLRRDSLKYIGLGLPECLYQPLQERLTEVTGLPYTGQPLPTQFSSPAKHFAFALFAFFFGFATLTYAIAHYDNTALSWLFALGLLFETAGLRRLQILVQHHCSHNNFWARIRSLNDATGRFASIVAGLTAYDVYKPRHIQDHHSLRGQNTWKDDTTVFLLRVLNLKLGASKRENWLRLALSLVSPYFHLRFASARMRSTLFDGPLAVRVAAWAYWSSAIAIAAFLHVLGPAAIAWVLGGIAFNIVSAIRFSFEHILDPSVQDIKSRDKTFVCRTTAGVFLLDLPYPHAERGLKRVCLEVRFWLFFFLYALPVSLVLCPGDTSQHDRHTRLIREDWWNSVWMRQQELENVCPGWPEAYWGFPSIRSAIDYNLDAMSHASEDRL